MFNQFLIDCDLYFLFFLAFVLSNFVFVQFAIDAMFALFVTNAEEIIFSILITFDDIFAHFTYVPVLLTIEALRQFILFIEIFANFKFVIFTIFFLMRQFVVFEEFISIINEKFFFDFDDFFESNNFCDFQIFINSHVLSREIFYNLALIDDIDVAHTHVMHDDGVISLKRLSRSRDYLCSIEFRDGFFFVFTNRHLKF